MKGECPSTGLTRKPNKKYASNLLSKTKLMVLMKKNMSGQRILGQIKLEEYR
jgi:hypothetical protein